MVPIVSGTLRVNHLLLDPELTLVFPKDKQVELSLLLSVNSSQYLGQPQRPNSMWMRWAALLKEDKVHQIKTFTDEFLACFKNQVASLKKTKISKQYQTISRCIPQENAFTLTLVNVLPKHVFFRQSKFNQRPFTGPQSKCNKVGLIAEDGCCAG